MCACSLLSRPLLFALQAKNVFLGKIQMRVAGRQRRLPYDHGLARAIHRLPHIASLLITKADVVQEYGNVRMPGGENPPTKLQHALLHRQRMLMSTEGTVCEREVAPNTMRPSAANPTLPRMPAWMLSRSADLEHSLRSTFTCPSML